MYEGCYVNSRTASIILTQTDKVYPYVTGNFKTFKMICYNDHFTIFVKNNKDINTNGVHNPGQFLPKFTTQIENVSIKNVPLCI